MTRLDRYLVIQQGDRTVRLALPSLGRLLLGRSARSAIPLSAAGLAAEHFEILLDHEVTVRFLAKGHIENDGRRRAVAAQEIQVLGPGDVVSIEGLDLRIDLTPVTPNAPRFLAPEAFTQIALHLPGSQAVRIEVGEDNLADLLAFASEAKGALQLTRGVALLYVDEASAGAAIDRFTQWAKGRGAQLHLQRIRSPAELVVPAEPSGPSIRLAHRDLQMLELDAQVDRAATSNANVVIVGETGTGKDLVALEILRRSGRTGPVVRASAVALVDAESLRARLDEAKGGVLIIDEITAMAPKDQLALAHGLDSAESAGTPIRVVSLSSQRLDQAVDEGRFRRELSYRLEALNITLPPLRDRRPEIAPLARAFAEAIGASIDGEALAALESHDFPGNVRELKNLVSRAHLASGGPIGLVHLPPSVTSQRRSAKSDVPKSLKDELAEIEKLRILEALRAHKTQRDAAEALDMPMRTFLTRLDEYGIPRARGGGQKKDE